MTTRTGSLKDPEGLRRSLRLPPNWIARVASAAHRAAHFVTGNRLGLKGATAGHQDLLRLWPDGHHPVRERRAVPGYLEGGSGRLLVAMSGPADPSWLPDLHGYTLIAWR